MQATVLVPRKLALTGRHHAHVAECGVASVVHTTVGVGSVDCHADPILIIDAYIREIEAIALLGAGDSRSGNGWLELAATQKGIGPLPPAAAMWYHCEFYPHYPPMDNPYYPRVL